MSQIVVKGENMQDFQDLNEFKRNFYNKYHTTLVPTVEQFENERKWNLYCAIFWTIVLITAGIIYFYIIIAFDINSSKSEETGFILIGSGISAYWLFKKKFERELKAKIMHVVASCFGNMVWSLSYSSKKAEKFVEAGLFSSFTNVIVDDRFSGTYKNVPIDIVEAEFEDGSGRNSTTVFKGLCIKLDMNKNFKGHTLLMEDTIFHTSPRSHLRHTELEDINFEKRYDVFTDDEVEARYILTPTFMEKLAGIKMAFYCRAIRCAFYQGELLIAMKPTTDLFSIGSLVRPVTDTRQFQNLCNQFCSVLSLIDYLKLNERAIL